MLTLQAAIFAIFFSLWGLSSINGDDVVIQLPPITLDTLPGPGGYILLIAGLVMLIPPIKEGIREFKVLLVKLKRFFIDVLQEN